MGFREAWKALRTREAKAQGAGPLLALYGTGQAAFMPRRYDAFADEGYRQNVVVRRAIDEITRGAASVPWLLYRRHGGGGGRETIAEHPLLRLLKQPNPLMANAEFIEALLGYLLIAGNSYIEALSSERGRPVELWLPRPDRMAVVKGKTGVPAGYVYKLNGQERRWDVDPLSGRSAILHLRTFNPLNDWYGLSPIESAALGIDQHNEAGKWNKALLQNGARPSGAIVYEPGNGHGNLDDVQFARVKNEIEEQYAGAKNAGRPMLLEGGLKWQEMSLNPKDMDFLNAKHTAARDILLAFGVPPQLLGIPGDNTYANYQEARLALWEQTILPLLSHLRDELNAWLAPLFGPDLELDIDLNQVPALTLRRARRWEMMVGAFKRGVITRDEARAGLGYGPLGPGAVDEDSTPPAAAKSLQGKT